MGKRKKKPKRKHRNPGTAQSKSILKKRLPIWLAPIVGIVLAAMFGVLVQFFLGEKVDIEPVIAMAFLGLLGGSLLWLRK